MELPFTHTDVTTVMDLLARIEEDVQGIRQRLEEDDGEEDLSENDS